MSEVVIGLGVTALFISTMFAIAVWASNSAAAEYCYVSATAGKYHLRAAVPWRFDRGLGEYASIEDAIKAAAVLGCQVK